MRLHLILELQALVYYVDDRTEYSPDKQVMFWQKIWHNNNSVISFQSDEKKKRNYEPAQLHVLLLLKESKVE